MNKLYLAKVLKKLEIFKIALLVLCSSTYLYSQVLEKTINRIEDNVSNTFLANEFKLITYNDVSEYQSRVIQKNSPKLSNNIITYNENLTNQKTDANSIVNIHNPIDLETLNPIENQIAANFYDEIEAKALFEKIVNDNLTVESFTPNALYNLPLAFPITQTGNVYLAIKKATFFSTHIELEVYAKAVFGNEVLYFGNDKIKYVSDEGFSGEADLNLLGNKQSKNSFYTLTLNGGDSGTRIKINCGKMTGLAVKGRFQLSSEKFDLIDTKGFIASNQTPIYSNIDTVLTDINHILIPIENLLPFTVKSQNKTVGFKIKKANINLGNINSNLLISSLLVASGYSTNEKDLWKGFYTEDLEVFLPNIFNTLNNQALIRASVNANSLVIDDQGLSFKLADKTKLSINNWSGFALQLLDLKLKYAKSQLTEFKLEGKLGLPISAVGDTLDASNLLEGEFINFSGTSDGKSDNMIFAFTKVTSLNFLSGETTVESGSSFDIVSSEVYDSKATYDIPKITVSLTGVWKFKHDFSKSSKLAVDTKRFYDIGEVGYTDFKLRFNIINNEFIPEISIDNIGAKSVGRIPLAGVGLEIIKVEPNFNIEKKELTFTFKSQTNLIPGYDAKEVDGTKQSSKPSLSFDTILSFKFTQPDNNTPLFLKDKVTFSPFKISNGDLGPLKIEGSVYLDVDGKNPIYGNHFSGSIKVETNNKTLLPIKVDVNLIVGNKDFFFMYLDGSFNNPNSQIAIPGTPLNLTGVGLGFYINMKKDLSDFGSTSKNASINDTKYIPEQYSGGFLIAMYAALKADPTKLNGSIGFDLEFSNKSDFSVTNVGLFGTLNCSATSKITPAAEKQALDNTMKQRLLKKKKAFDSKKAAIVAKAQNSANKVGEAGKILLDAAKSYVMNDDGDDYGEDDDYEKDIKPTPEAMKNTVATFTIKGNFDITKSVLDAQLKAYIKISNSTIDTPIWVGAVDESSGLAGVATMHIGSDNWKLWIGTPSSKFKLKYTLSPAFNLNLSCFLGFGTAPLTTKSISWPTSITTAINNTKSKVRLNMDFDQEVLSNNAKVFFGADAEISTSARSNKAESGGAVGVAVDFSLGIGLAGLIINNSCPVPNTPTFVLKAAVALSGKVDIFVNVFGAREKFNIFNTTGGVFADVKVAKGNSYIQGTGFINYSILGGIFKGDAYFQVESGSQAKCNNVFDLSSGNVNIVKNSYPKDYYDNYRDMLIEVTFQYVPYYTPCSVILQDDKGNKVQFDNLFLIGNYSVPEGKKMKNADDANVPINYISDSFYNTRTSLSLTPGHRHTGIKWVHPPWYDCQINFTFFFSNGKNANGQWKKIGNFEQKYTVQFRTQGVAAWPYDTCYPSDGYNSNDQDVCQYCKWTLFGSRTKPGG
jgi:hypothetical protein